MKEQNSEYRGCQRIEYCEYARALRRDVLLAERLNGESYTAADYSEGKYGSPLAAALRKTQIFEEESSDESKDRYEEELIY